jgi:hypothetical protein
MLLLILHSLQIVQILDGVLNLVKSLNAVVMIVYQHLLRLFAFALPEGLLPFVFPFMICSETSKATAFYLYDGISVI